MTAPRHYLQPLVDAWCDEKGLELALRPTLIVDELTPFGEPQPELDAAFARALAEAPYVCPGCHAVGEERCAPGCIDAEMAEADRAYETDREDPRDEEVDW